MSGPSSNCAKRSHTDVLEHLEGCYKRHARSPNITTEHTADATLLNGLPVYVWAKSLDLLPHEDLIRCSTVSKSFLREVSPLIQRIMILPNASSSSLRYFPSKRFPNVRDVYLYNVISDIGDPRMLCKYELLDDMNAVVPFLANFPKLETAFLGGLYTCSESDEESSNKAHKGWDAEYVRKDRDFKPITRSVHTFTYDDNGAKYMKQHTQLIEDIASAYHQGRLGKTVLVHGIFSTYGSPRRKENVCPWKQAKANQILLTNGDDTDDDDNDNDNNSTENVPCKCCRAICSFFPIKNIILLEDYHTPCIAMKDRTQIATRRAAAEAKKFLTLALCSTLARLSLPMLTQNCMTYEGKHDRIRLFVSQGADVKDPTVRRTVLAHKENEGHNINSMTQNSYRLLTELCIIIKSDFGVITEKEMKDQWMKHFNIE